MLDLLVSLGGLLLGPVTYRASRRSDEIYGFIDGFVLVGVAGLILTEVIPDTVRQAGPWALCFAAVGFVLPFALERRLALLPFSPNVFFRWLMILGLLLHQLLDGVALSYGTTEGAVWLRLAVILHQVPKGFFIWGMVGAAMGSGVAVVVITALCLTTVAGFELGGGLSGVLAARPLLFFQAFVGGGLLHVIAHHVPRGAAEAGASADCSAEPGGTRAPWSRFSFFSGLGALASLAGLVVLSRGRAADTPGQAGFGAVFTDLVIESAPFILLGFAAAGIFTAFLPRFFFSWFRGRGRMSQALRGIALGMPLPICSCGVAPVYLSLLRKGVPPAAALAFLIATPEIGIDSVFISAKWLGVQITLIRLAMAFLIALAVGLTLARIFERIQKSGELDRLALPEERPLPATFRGKLREALRFGGVEIVDHTGAWLLAGIAVAAVIEPYGPDKIGPFPHGIDVLVLSLLGLPLYVCASGATPLAAVLLKKGISTGAVLAFLITGPATNVTTFGIVKRNHGVKGALLFAAAVYGFTVTIGFAINWLFPGPVAPVQQIFEIGGHEHGPVYLASALVLGALFAGSLCRLGPRGFLASLGGGFLGLHGGDGHGHDHHHDHHDHEDHRDAARQERPGGPATESGARAPDGRPATTPLP